MPEDLDDVDGRDHGITRRRLLRTGGPMAAGTLAGCSRSAITDGPPSTTDGRPTETQGRPTEPDEPADRSTAGVQNLEPPGRKRPLAEKYPGLRVLDTWRAGEADDRSVYAEYTTPIESHFVVSHFETPVLDADEHVVTIVDANGATIEVGVEELLADHPTETVTHTMQCAGNGRKYFADVGGWDFGYGALGTAEWTGVPVEAVFSAHDVVVPDDAWVTAAGADGPANDADLVFARSIPVSKLFSDCLLVYEMNGSPIPLEHGFPVRLLVPGWYGTNSVKWLSELRVADGMVRGERWREYSEWQHYHYRIRPEGVEARENDTVDSLDTWTQIERKAADEIEPYPYVYDMTVKSLIGYPGEGASVSPRDADGAIEIVGVAWAGDDRVERVEVSTDGGETWNRAPFFGPDRGPAAWRRFRYLWEPAPGTYAIYSRATDEHGRAQPAEIAEPGTGLRSIRDGTYPWNQGGYASNAWRDLGVDVIVE